MFLNKWFKHHHTTSLSFKPTLNVRSMYQSSLDELSNKKRSKDYMKNLWSIWRRINSHPKTGRVELKKASGARWTYSDKTNIECSWYWPLLRTANLHWYLQQAWIQPEQKQCKYEDTRRQRGDKRIYHLKHEDLSTLDLHLLPISWSTLIDKDGNRFILSPSLLSSLLIVEDWSIGIA